MYNGFDYCVKLVISVKIRVSTYFYNRKLMEFFFSSVQLVTDKKLEAFNKA